MSAPAAPHPSPHVTLSAVMEDVRCPACHALWCMRERVADTAIHEQRCRSCKRLVRYTFPRGRLAVRSIW